MAAQKITYKQVVKACQKAYQENRLIAQHDDDYGYLVNGHVCAIGAALSPTTLTKIEESGGQKKSVGCLGGTGILDFSDIDGNKFETLQSVHDSWLSNSEGHTPNNFEFYRDKFLRMIDLA